ncbi:hypothetical protein IPM09_01235 [Candidatus Saccharibacteria bacterium]|nr:MAG: hypothetical protein IPM09_01235 [Candidatus Saccharibacteria bacterium]
MKQYLKRSVPAVFFTNTAYFRALALGTVYLFLAITQLFTFEKFADVTVGYGMVGGDIVAALVAGLMPLLEVAALPYLLSMRLSSRARQVSKFAVIAAPSVWFAIGFYLTVVGKIGINSGLMGATLYTPVSWWIVIFAALFSWAALLVVRELPKRRGA